MQLYVHHYHLRPGGVRRVIELELPAIARAGSVARVVLLCGEAGAAAWRTNLRARLPVPCEVRVHDALGYAIESPAARPARLDRIVADLLADARRDDVLWLHNPAIGRNHAAIDALGRCAARRGLRLVFHHHDFWMDHRWHRWHDLRAAGARSIREVAATLAPPAARVVHLAINRRDAATLHRHASTATAWLPDPVTRPASASAGRTAEAARWLHRAAGTDRPVWLVPCRLLRRKNLAESLLLMRWFAPDALLATTGGPSSADERPYARALADHARRRHWPLRIGLLATTSAHPDLPDLLRAADTLAFTSIQEGFGLPFIEAAFARRPFLCRLLPHVTDDLQALGLRFPGGYEDVLVPDSLFDAPRERRRQTARHALWSRRLPYGVAPPGPPEPPGAVVAFSRLTLAAQLEVLAVPPEMSWAACRPLNPALFRLREGGAIPVMRGGAAAATIWSPGTLAARWWSAVRRAHRPGNPLAGERLQAGLMEAFLALQHLHPLLWSEEP